jgi:hypothetical protein
MDIPTLEELPTEFEVVMWVGFSPYSKELGLYQYDMSDQGYAMLGTVKLTVSVPQTDPREKMIEGLKAKRDRVHAEYLNTLSEIDESIQQLRALPAPVDARARNEDEDEQKERYNDL